MRSLFYCFDICLVFRQCSVFDISRNGDQHGVHESQGTRMFMPLPFLSLLYHLILPFHESEPQGNSWFAPILTFKSLEEGIQSVNIKTEDVSVGCARINGSLFSCLYSLDPRARPATQWSLGSLKVSCIYFLVSFPVFLLWSVSCMCMVLRTISAYLLLL